MSINSPWIAFLYTFGTKLGDRFSTFFGMGIRRKKVCIWLVGMSWLGQKFMGGWGIKNIFHFGYDSAAKSLWRGLFSKRMWSDVLKEKYLEQESVVEWIRKEKKCFRGISNS